MRTPNIRHTLIGGVAALALTACQGNVEVKGKVSESNGSQTQQSHLTTYASGISPGFGGQGSVAAASNVRAQSVGSGGTTSVIAESKVEASGSYSLSIPEGSERVVIEAVDANGQVVASALLDSTAGAENNVRHAPPMTSESSIEAQVFVKMVQEGTSADSI